MKKFSKYFVIALLSVVVVYFAFFYRIPDLYITKPGPVADAMEMVSVADHTSKIDPSLSKSNKRKPELRSGKTG
jgi:PDZ domain-containing protein